MDTMTENTATSDHANVQDAPVAPFRMQTRHAANEINTLIRKRYDRLGERPELEVFRRAVLIEHHGQHEDDVTFF